MTEQGYLTLSLAATLCVAAFGILMGLVSGSSAIVFDGVYSLADAGMTLLALFVSQLILRSTAQDQTSKRLGERFNMGLWHLEPLVIAIDGLMLMSVAVYAFVNGLKGLASGGQPVEFGPALIYAGVALVICASMAMFGRRRNRTLRSDLIALDVKAWIMSSSITGALLLAFVLGLLLRGTRGEWMLLFVDPLTLVVVSLAIIPAPLREVWQAIREILLVTPVELRAQVEAVARRVAREQGFLGHRTYVAEFGRAVQIELYFVVPRGFPARPLEEWDALRDQVGEAIGGVERHRWLTVLFTTDPEWAE